MTQLIRIGKSNTAFVKGISDGVRFPQGAAAPADCRSSAGLCNPHERGEQHPSQRAGRRAG